MQSLRTMIQIYIIVYTFDILVVELSLEVRHGNL